MPNLYAVMLVVTVGWLLGAATYLLMCHRDKRRDLLHEQRLWDRHAWRYMGARPVVPPTLWQRLCRQVRR